MGLFWQEAWTGLSLPPPGDLPDPAIKPESPVAPALAGGSFTWDALPPITCTKNLMNQKQAHAGSDGSLGKGWCAKAPSHFAPAPSGRLQAECLN